MHSEIVIKRFSRCTCGGRKRASLEIHLEAVVKRVRRYALGGHDHANLQAVIEQVWRYIWRPWSSYFGNTLWGLDRGSLEINLKALIERVWRCTWRPWSSEFRDTLGGRNGATLEEYLEAVDGRRSEIQFISVLTRNHGNMTRWLYHWSTYGELAGVGWSVGR